MRIFNRKSAQGLSMTVIVVAAIALLVLVILAVIFIGRMGTTADKVDACKGSCVYSEEDCTGKYSKVTSYNAEECPEDTPVCCISV